MHILINNQCLFEHIYQIFLETMIFIIIIFRIKTEQNMKGVNNGKKFLDSSEEDKKKSSESQTKSHEIILGDTSTAIPDIDVKICTLTLPHGISLEKINLFKTAYRKHCEVSEFLKII